MGKQRVSKQFFAVLVSVCLIAGMLSGCSRERSQEQSAALVSLQKTVEYYEKIDQISHWEELIALYGATQADGLKVDWNTMEMPNTPIPDGTSGAYAISIITNMAKGMPDRDLVSQLAALQNPENGSFDADSIEQHIWSMISLNVSQGADNYNYKDAAAWLLNFQGKDGGFSNAMDGSAPSDAYLSGIAAVALSPYQKGNMDNSAVKKLIRYFKEQQLPDGGYEQNGAEHPSAISAAIWGLTALEQDLPKSRSDKKTPLDALLTFQNEDGSFNITGDSSGTADPEATRRAAIALSDIVNGADTYVLLAQDAQQWRLEHTSGPAVTISIDYPYDSKLKDVEKEEITVNQGYSALDALLYFGKLSDIPIEFIGPQQNATVTAINRVKNDDYGYDSRWTLKINGQISDLGASAVILQAGDQIEWIYVDSMDSLSTPITPSAANTAGNPLSSESAVLEPAAMPAQTQ